MRQAQSVVFGHLQAAVELAASERLDQPIELDFDMLSEVSGAGPCGGWAPAAPGPVTTAAGPCGGW